MKITYCDDYKRMSAQAASLVIAEIEQQKNLLLVCCGRQLAQRVVRGIGEEVGGGSGALRRAERHQVGRVGRGSRE
jgi:hypothetical protein